MAGVEVQGVGGGTSGGGSGSGAMAGRGGHGGAGAVGSFAHPRQGGSVDDAGSQVPAGMGAVQARFSGGGVGGAVGSTSDKLGGKAYGGRQRSWTVAGFSHASTLAADDRGTGVAASHAHATLAAAARHATHTGASKEKGVTNDVDIAKILLSVRPQSNLPASPAKGSKAGMALAAGLMAGLPISSVPVRKPRTMSMESLDSLAAAAAVAEHAPVLAPAPRAGDFGRQRSGSMEESMRKYSNGLDQLRYGAEAASVSSYSSYDDYDSASHDGTGTAYTDATSDPEADDFMDGDRGDASPLALRQSSVSSPYADERPVPAGVRRSGRARKRSVKLQDPEPKRARPSKVREHPTMARIANAARQASQRRRRSYSMGDLPDGGGASVPTTISAMLSPKYAKTYNTGGRIGIYTRSERSALLRRFHEKRKRRVWNKTIRYGCRKNLADSRIRVKGRFVKAGTPEAIAYLAEQAKLQGKSGKGSSKRA